jgi:hypothetical protein
MWVWAERIFGAVVREQDGISSAAGLLATRLAIGGAARMGHTRTRAWTTTDSSRSPSEVDQLVGDVFGCEGVQHRHDPPGEIKVGGTAVGNQNACVGALLAERRLVQPFIVAAIVREHRQLVFGGKV